MFPLETARFRKTKQLLSRTSILVFMYYVMWPVNLEKQIKMKSENIINSRKVEKRMFHFVTVTHHRVREVIAQLVKRGFGSGFHNTSYI